MLYCSACAFPVKQRGFWYKISIKFDFLKIMTSKQLDLKREKESLNIVEKHVLICSNPYSRPPIPPPPIKEKKLPTI